MGFSGSNWIWKTHFHDQRALLFWRQIGVGLSFKKRLSWWASCWQYSQFVYTDLRLSNIENNLNSYAADMMVEKLQWTRSTRLNIIIFAYKTLETLEKAKPSFRFVSSRWSYSSSPFMAFMPLLSRATSIQLQSNRESLIEHYIRTHDLQLNLNDFLKLLDLHLLS